MNSNRTRAPAATLCLVFCAATLLAGCGQQPDDDYKIVRGDPGDGAPDASSDAAAKPNTVRLSQNFGVLHPGERHFGVFEVENPTSSAWTLESITTSCSCTATRPEAGSIAPHSKLKFNVRYSAGGNTRDETRVVEIRFKEPDAPLVELTVNVSIRAPITVEPDGVRIYCAPDGKQHTELSVENYSPKVWDTLTVSSPTKWIKALAHRTQFIPVPASEAVPLEKWTVDIAVSAARMSPGDYSGEVVLSAGGNTEHAPVEMLVRGPVSLIPSQLFFGRVKIGQVASRDVVARFANGQTPKAAADFSIPRNLGGQLTLTFATDSEGYGRIHAELKATACGEITGSVRVLFGDGPEGARAVPLPVFADVEPISAAGQAKHGAPGAHAEAGDGRTGNEHGTR